MSDARLGFYLLCMVWILGLCVGGYFGYQDGKKAGMKKAQVHCKYCHHELSWE